MAGDGHVRPAGPDLGRDLTGGDAADAGRAERPAPGSTDRRLRCAIARLPRSVCGRVLFPVTPGDVSPMLAHNVVGVGVDVGQHRLVRDFSRR